MAAQRITVKIEREPIVTRRTPSDPQSSPDLLIQVRSMGNLREGLDTAIRLLVSERDAILAKQPVQQDEEDEEDDI